MKATETLKERFGANMRESMGVGVPGFPSAIPAGGPITGGRGRNAPTMKRAFLIPLDRIVPDPDQPRREFDPGELDDLAESLKARGQLQPVRVRWDESAGTWVLISGERRYRAAKLAGLATLEAVEAKGTLTAEEILEDQLVENCLRSNLKPIEQANAFRTLMEAKGWTFRRLAEHLRLPHSAVSQSVGLLRLDGDAQEKVERGEIPPATAYVVSTVDDPGERAALVERVVNEKLSRDATADAVREVKAKAEKGRGASKAKGKGKPTPLKVRQFKAPAGRVMVELRKAGDIAAMRLLLLDVVAMIEAETEGDQRLIAEQPGATT